jgi:hypothetical protein
VQSARVAGELGDDLEGALASLVRTVEEMPGAYRAEFSLEYWAGVESAEAWCCTVAGDIRGDDGDRFSIVAPSAADALRRASEEALRRSSE